MLVSPLCINLYAQQQIPNSDFESEWTNCVPWTFYVSEEKHGEISEVVAGKNPTGWIISNVAGMASYYEGSASGLGTTLVGDSVEGFNSNCAVKLTNNPNPFMAAQIVPGYMTLGPAWSTANPSFSFTGITINNSDGGAFGGMEFNERPTGIEFMYKRSRGEDKPAEKSTVVAYLWKGHWTQKDVPAVVYMSGDPVCKDMTDRDRCILGMDMTGCQGGEVSKSDDAELIAVINAEITDDASEWTKFSATFDYKSDATPEMINIIIAAGDYFGGASVVGKDNSLIVDDVKLIYAENDKNVYSGVLNIEMMGNALATNKPATIEITPAGEGKCTFTLPDFVLEMPGAEPMILGDIVVNDVTTSEENGVTTYNGQVNGLQLAEGAIVADVTLNGTISGNNVVMNIDVMWSGIPIKVTFTSTTSAITDINADINAPVEYFNIQGMRVNADNMAPGIYVKRQGNKVSKILVK